MLVLGRALPRAREALPLEQANQPRRVIAIDDRKATDPPGEHAQSARGEVLEIAIVALIVVEIVLSFFR
jgi:hypothetical protein